MRSFIPIILIGISVVAGLTFGKNLNSEVKTLRSEVKEYNKALDNSTELEKVRDSIIDTYNKITNSDKNRLDRFLPDNSDNIGLILEIQKLANNHGLLLKDIVFNTIDPKEDDESVLSYSIFKMGFSVKGEYISFVSFLEDLENNLRLINVTSITFSPPSEKSVFVEDPNIYEYDLGVEAYWLKD
ncbi:MAG: type 4a pilus biogenesis protein PilO [Patescibacteria group bacterium]|nr:type 4a pilus biogenesis protein PilO [Patescibacteria group bacterium]